MLDQPYGPNVRVICRPAGDRSSNLCVEVRDPAQPQGWREVQRFNDMSDDYALTNARQCAIRVRATLKEGENV